MATHDYIINNQSAPDFRADLNNALLAIVSQNSGSSAPGTTYANMLWYDTSTNEIKKRNEANSAWVVLGTVDEGAGTFTPTGLPATASQAEAEAGTNNTKMMTPLRAAQAIAALGGLGGVNIQSFTASGTYTPTSGYKYALVIATGGGRGGSGVVSGGGSTSGGAAGDTCMSILSLASLAAQTVTIGAGSSGTQGTPSAGGNTSVGTLVVAKGGGSGTANVGTFQISGSAGGAGGVYSAGEGGGTFWGPGAPQGTTSSGIAATVYGGGGSGGYASSGSVTGGNGKSGVVFILEFK